MAHEKVELSIMVDVRTADEIDRISKAWNMSWSGTMRFMIKHYLKFGIKKHTGGKIMSKQKLTPQEKDNLIEILKEVNEAKDQIFDKLTSDLVFTAHRIKENDKIFQKIKDMIC